MRKRKKSAVLVVLLVMTFSLGMLRQPTSEPPTHGIGVAVTYAAAKTGNLSAEEGAALGVSFVVQGAVQGAIWGSVFGGPAGTVAGAVVGL